jgi:hypothetical protein
MDPWIFFQAPPRLGCLCPYVTAIIDMYTKSGHVTISRRLFDSAREMLVTTTMR